DYIGGTHEFKQAYRRTGACWRWPEWAARGPLSQTKPPYRSGWRRNSASRNKLVTTNSTTTEATARVGVTDKVTSSHICLGSVVFSPPPTNRATVSSSNTPGAASSF